MGQPLTWQNVQTYSGAGGIKGYDAAINGVNSAAGIVKNIAENADKKAEAKKGDNDYQLLGYLNSLDTEARDSLVKNIEEGNYSGLGDGWSADSFSKGFGTQLSAKYNDYLSVKQKADYDQRVSVFNNSAGLQASLRSLILSGKMDEARQFAFDYAGGNVDLAMAFITKVAPEVQDIAAKDLAMQQTASQINQTNASAAESLARAEQTRVSTENTKETQVVGYPVYGEAFKPVVQELVKNFAIKEGMEVPPEILEPLANTIMTAYQGRGINATVDADALAQGISGAVNEFGKLMSQIKGGNATESQIKGILAQINAGIVTSKGTQESINATSAQNGSTTQHTSQYKNSSKNQVGARSGSSASSSNGTPFAGNVTAKSFLNSLGKGNAPTAQDIPKEIYNEGVHQFDTVSDTGKNTQTTGNKTPVKASDIVNSNNPASKEKTNQTPKVQTDADADKKIIEDTTTPVVKEESVPGTTPTGVNKVYTDETTGITYDTDKGTYKLPNGFVGELTKDADGNFYTRKERVELDPDRNLKATQEQIDEYNRRFPQSVIQAEVAKMFENRAGEDAHVKNLPVTADQVAAGNKDTDVTNKGNTGTGVGGGKGEQPTTGTGNDFFNSDGTTVPTAHSNKRTPIAKGLSQESIDILSNNNISLDKVMEHLENGDLFNNGVIDADKLVALTNSVYKSSEATKQDSEVKKYHKKLDEASKKADADFIRDIRTGRGVFALANVLTGDSPTKGIKQEHNNSIKTKIQKLDEYQKADNATKAKIDTLIDGEYSSKADFLGKVAATRKSLLELGDITAYDTVIKSINADMYMSSAELKNKEDSEKKQIRDAIANAALTEKLNEVSPNSTEELSFLNNALKKDGVTGYLRNQYEKPDKERDNLGILYALTQNIVSLKSLNEKEKGTDYGGKFLAKRGFIDDNNKITPKGEAYIQYAKDIFAPSESMEQERNTDKARRLKEVLPMFGIPDKQVTAKMGEKFIDIISKKTPTSDDYAYNMPKTSDGKNEASNSLRSYLNGVNIDENTLNFMVSAFGHGDKLALSKDAVITMAYLLDGAFKDPSNAYNSVQQALHQAEADTTNTAQSSLMQKLVSDANAKKALADAFAAKK